MKNNPGRWHTIYSIISTAVEETAIAAVLLWVLPMWGITLPLWGVIAILIGFLIFSYFMYIIGHPTILYKEISAPEAIIGDTGIVEKPLNPRGYIKIHGERWKASAAGEYIEKGEEVIVTGINKLELYVIRKTPANKG
ncbi:MAG: NfeD family protein [Dehalococcoidia bacterium]|nr:NfeD family protein [Dehalococcoidia bacterium]